nr:hypothetical protein [Tanacetum cinerariifolium]
MQLEEKELHQKCLAWFTKLKIHLELLYNNKFLVGSIMRLYETAFQIFFQEEYVTFRVKIYQNLNQLQWQLERKQESLVSKSTTLEACLVTEGAVMEACLDTKGATLKTCLVIEGVEMDDSLGAMESTYDFVTSSKQLDKSSNSRNECSTSGNESRKSDHESTSSRNDVDVDIGPSFDNDTMSEVHHDMFDNVFTHQIQNHEQPEPIPDTYVVNENNSNIISDIPTMDPDRHTEEHDYVDFEQQSDFFTSLINNLKRDVEKCNEVNREAQQVNALLTNKLERYKEKEKHFAKDNTIESEYCKNIKLLNDEISNLKSQACKKDKTFTKENEMYDEYV